MSEAEGSTIIDGATNRNPSNSSALICINLPVSAVKKENFFTADDKGLTLINADKENRDRNNFDANKFEIIPCRTIGFTLMRTVNGFEEKFEMKFRKLAFKLHLYLGLVVGISLAVIALTGSLLIFSPEIERFFNPQLLQVIPQVERIPLENVLQIVEKAYPQNQALSILLPRSAKEVCQVWMRSKSEEVVSVYVNTYSGKIKGARLDKETLTVLF